MLHKYCQSERNHRLGLVSSTESKTHSHRTSQSSPLKLAVSKRCPFCRPSFSFRNSGAFIRRPGCRLGGLLAGSAGTARRGRCQARWCFTGPGFQETLPAEEPGLRRSWKPKPQRRPPPAPRQSRKQGPATAAPDGCLRPAPPSTFPGSNSSCLRTARLPHRACARPLSRRPRRARRCLAGAERSGDGAARPQGPGLRPDAQGGGEGESGAGQALFPQEDGGREVSAWRRGEGSGRPAGPGGSTRPAGRAPGRLRAPRPPASVPSAAVARRGRGPGPAPRRRSARGHGAAEGGGRRLAHAAFEKALPAPASPLPSRPPCPEALPLLLGASGTLGGFPPLRRPPAGRPASRAPVLSPELRACLVPSLWKRCPEGVSFGELLQVAVSETAPGPVRVAVRKPPACYVYALTLLCYCACKKSACASIVE